MSHSVVNAERYPSVASAVFDNAELAQETIEALVKDMPIAEEQVDLVSPHDPDLDRKLERGGNNIYRTILRSHTSLGITGGLVGFVLAVLVQLGGYVLDIALIQSNVIWFYVLLTAFGVAFGMMAAGFASIKPSHEPSIMQTERAAGQGWWTVVVHARNEQQKKRAEDILARHGHHLAGAH